MSTAVSWSEESITCLPTSTRQQARPPRQATTRPSPASNANATSLPAWALSTMSRRRSAAGTYTPSYRKSATKKARATRDVCVCAHGSRCRATGRDTHPERYAGPTRAPGGATAPRRARSTSAPPTAAEDARSFTLSPCWYTTGCATSHVRRMAHPGLTSTPASRHAAPATCAAAASARMARPAALRPCTVAAVGRVSIHMETWSSKPRRMRAASSTNVDAMRAVARASPHRRHASPRQRA
mmetsp:Transcript_20540/g.55285  ORF Transcript_20540/g.55285 Transcript_20540/m.55285 type:complete len:241 (-) Transcript_20540:709-1431(-)